MSPITPSPFRSLNARLIRTADEALAAILAADRAIARIVGPRRIGKTDLVSAYARSQRIPLLNCPIRPLLADTEPSGVLAEIVAAEIASLAHTSPKLHRAFTAIMRKGHSAGAKDALGVELTAGPLHAAASTERSRAEVPAPTPSASTLLRHLNLAAAELGVRPVVFFDEVQELAVGRLAARGKAAIWDLRNEIQHHTAARYVFAGSNQRLFTQLQAAKSSPLLNLGTALELPPLTQAEIDAWAVPLFTAGKRHVRSLAAACRLLCGKIGEVAEVCDWLWANSKPNDVLDDALQPPAVHAVVGGQAPIELATRRLTPAQATVLRWVLLNPGISPYASKLGLNDGTIHRALGALVELGLVETWGRSRFYIASPLQTMLTISPAHRALLPSRPV